LASFCAYFCGEDATNSACPDAHDLNFSNRTVRIRMPSGVAGAQLMMAAPYADIFAKK
jgi:hypothetical protein